MPDCQTSDVYLTTKQAIYTWPPNKQCMPDRQTSNVYLTAKQAIYTWAPNKQYIPAAKEAIIHKPFLNSDSVDDSCYVMVVLRNKNGVLYGVRAIATCYNNEELCFIYGPCWGLSGWVPAAGWSKVWSWQFTERLAKFRAFVNWKECEHGITEHCWRRVVKTVFQLKYKWH
jgi:hypothetical protein